MTRRLLVIAATAVLGYIIGRADAAYGHAPWLIVCLTAALSWLAGAVWAASPARKRPADRTDIALAMQAHPSVRSKVTPLPRQSRGSR